MLKHILLSLIKVKLNIFIEIVPDVEKTPNTHYWYYFINSFSNDLMKKWVATAPKKQEASKEEGDDLFDDEPVAKKVEPVAKPQPKKKK